MKYTNKRNGKVVELVEMNEKYKTVMLQEGSEKPFTVTTSTFKRWYKKIEEQEVDPQREDYEEYLADQFDKECAAADEQVAEEDVPVHTGEHLELDRIMDELGYFPINNEFSPVAYSTSAHEVMAWNTVAEGMAWAAAQLTGETVEKDTPKAKPEKKVRAKKQPVDFTDLLQYIDEVAAEHNMVPYVREKQPYLRNYRINGEGPVVFLVYTRSKAQIQCKTKLLPETVYDNMKKANHCFDRQFDIVTDTDREFAKTIITSITVPAK